MPHFLKSGDKGMEKLIQWGTSYWVESCFDRIEKLKPCPMGASGACCKHCHMGPCRFVQSSEERVEKGVCGAKLSCVTARNFLRNAASGAAGHAEHARDMVSFMLSIARGEAKDFDIVGLEKLREMADTLGIEPAGKAPNVLAREVAQGLLDDFGRQKGQLHFVKRVPPKTLQRWREWNIVPRGIDREVTEALYRTNLGSDHDPESLLLSALRVSLADGWGSSMIAADVSEVIFGPPVPNASEAGAGIFEKENVNILIIGNQPALAKAISDVASERELLQEASSRGAGGIFLGGILASSKGVPMAGSFACQELCLMTGLIDAVVIGDLCVMPTVAEVAGSFHTRAINVSPRANYPDLLQMPFDITRAKDIAREIVKTAIENYPNRTGMGEQIEKRPPRQFAYSMDEPVKMVEGGTPGLMRTLNGCIRDGGIRGIAAIIGTDNPRVQATGMLKYLVGELIRDDVLVFTTECASAACTMSDDADVGSSADAAGAGLLEACAKMGIPPVVQFGTCDDNSRVLRVLAAMVFEGGLAEEIGGLPAVIVAPEWISEGEIAEACYFAASGVRVILGGTSPVKASEDVEKIMSEDWYEKFKGSLDFEPDPGKMLEMVNEFIDQARAELGLDAKEEK
ncbi:MAG: hypothetical protein PVJ36_00455 [Nitrospirota bacterium]|jgi:carbon-monoxide dehydrogenase catalytic subunit